MANTYKNNITAITATGSSEVIYTCPSNATAIVILFLSTMVQ